MYRFAIVEDSDEDANNLQNCLAQYKKEFGEEISVERFNSAAAFLAVVSEGNYSAVFMDVDMPDMTGMEASHKLRDAGNDIVIVFVTNLAQYAIEGYEVHALDFILKPVNYFSFRMKMKRVLQAAKSIQSRDKMVCVNSAGEKLYLKESEIDYVEVQAHDLLIHLKGQVIRVIGSSLTRLEQELSEEHFFRCNYCYLVNLSHITGISSTEVTVGGDKLLISRNRKKEFMDKAASYFGRGGK